MATPRRSKTRRRKRQSKKLAASIRRFHGRKKPIIHRGGRREWRGDGAGRIKSDRHKRYLAEVESAREAARSKLQASRPVPRSRYPSTAHVGVWGISGATDSDWDTF